MASDPLPVVMVSSLTQQGADITIECLELGAIDFVAKPSGSISIDLYKVRDMLIEKVLTAGRVKLKGRQVPISKPAIETAKQPIVGGSDSVRFRAGKQLICIGTSTGAEGAAKSASQASQNVEGACFIVQHMPKGFTASLANRLNHLSEVTVKEAENGERAKDGWVYIAPGGKTWRSALKRANW